MMCERTKGEAPFTNLLEIQHYKDKKYTQTNQTNKHTHKKKNTIVKAIGKAKRELTRGALLKKQNKTKQNKKQKGVENAYMFSAGSKKNKNRKKEEANVELGLLFKYLAFFRYSSVATFLFLVIFSSSHSLPVFATQFLHSFVSLQ